MYGGDAVVPSTVAMPHAYAVTPRELSIAGPPKSEILLLKKVLVRIRFLLLRRMRFSFRLIIC